MSDQAGREIYEVVTLEGSKYTFRYNKDTCLIDCLRFGKPWREFPVGDKALYCLFQKAYDTKDLVEEIERLKIEVEDQRQRAAEWEELYNSTKKGWKESWDS